MTTRFSRRGEMQFRRDLAARLARYAELAYEEPGDVRARLTDKPAADKPERDIDFLSRGGTQAYVIRCSDMTVVAFRGTQFAVRFSLRDFITNGLVRRVAWDPGKAHHGYARAYRRISEDLAKALATAPRPHYFCGHSLGGALATLASTRQPAPTATYTFGSTRVGNGSFAREVRHLFRIVHEDDIAPKFPFLLGYRHSGEGWHLARDGTLSRGVEGWRTWIVPGTDRGFSSGFEDHHIENYRHALERR